jgi:DNA-binding protein WhiA
MSFSEDVRRELVARPPARDCCRLAFLAGLIRHSGSLQVRAGGELAVVAELGDPAAARLAFTLLRERGGDCEILSFREHRFERRNRELLRIAGGGSIQLLHEAGVLSAGLTPLARPPERLLRRSCCRGSYLRGAFVACGSVSAPRRPAHLELRTAELDAAQGLAGVAAREQIALGIARRRGHVLAYLKSRDAVRDMLALIGAHDAVLSFEEGEVISATREAANRLTNCDRANLGRASAAAHRQREAIALLDLDLIDPDLRRVAELRMAHPSSSLAELGQRARPPLTKSAVARRMKTLISLTKS